MERQHGKQRITCKHGGTKAMICGTGLDTIKPSGKYLCNVCRTGVGRNLIYCTSCVPWVHKKCCGIKDRLVDIPDFKCHRCVGLARPVDGRPADHVSLGDQKVEVVESSVLS